MMRKMVGTLLDVGRGRLQPEDIEKTLRTTRPLKSGPTVPPQGLAWSKSNTKKPGASASRSFGRQYPIAD